MCIDVEQQPTDCAMPQDSVVQDSGPQDDKQRIYEAVREIAEKRSVIDQAKGMLMIIYGVDADDAFTLLRWQSQHHNVKLRAVAEQVVTDFSKASKQGRPVDRRTYDRLLASLHTRTEPTMVRDVVSEMADRINVSP